jgi:hypothetical protein
MNYKGKMDDEIESGRLAYLDGLRGWGSSYEKMDTL